MLFWDAEPRITGLSLLFHHTIPTYFTKRKDVFQHKSVNVIGAKSDWQTGTACFGRLLFSPSESDVKDKVRYARSNEREKGHNYPYRASGGPGWLDLRSSHAKDYPTPHHLRQRRHSPLSHSLALREELISRLHQMMYLFLKRRKAWPHEIRTFVTARPTDHSCFLKNTRLLFHFRYSRHKNLRCP